MATKKTAKTEAKLPAMSDKEKAELVSKFALKPSANGAAVVEAFSKGVAANRKLTHLEVFC